MKPKEILSLVTSLGTSNIDEILFTYDIGIFYQPSLFKEKDRMDAVIITAENGQTGIFFRINPYPADPVQNGYINLIKWHEFGHYLIHGPECHTRSFDLKHRSSREESEANMFAMFALIRPSNVFNRNIFNTARSIGIPVEIAVEVIYRLSLDSDPEMQKYYSEYM